MSNAVKGSNSGGQVASSVARVKAVSFFTVLGALGNVLSLLSIMVAPISEQVNLDFSHAATFIAAIYGGPVIGALTGFIGGFTPAIMFGYVTGQLGVFGFTIPVGKAFTGLCTGLLVKWLKPAKRRYGSLALILMVVIGYVPEAAWTVFVFQTLIPLFAPNMAFLAMFLSAILVKAFAEMVILGFLMAALLGNQGFTIFLERYFIRPPIASSKS